MTRTLLIFVAGALAGIAALAVVYQLGDNQYGAICVWVAGIICLLPTLASMALTLWSKGRSGSEQLMAVMGGMVFRMGAVFALALPVFLKVPQFRETKERELTYWSAILICYVGTLAWETILSARQKTTPTGAGPAPTAGGVGE